MLLVRECSTGDAFLSGFQSEWKPSGFDHLPSLSFEVYSVF